MTENEIANQVFKCALTVHKLLGSGLLESAYSECLYYELIRLDLHVEKQKSMPLIYKDIKLEVGYRIDLMIENKFVIEVKSVDALNDIHLSQILTYLKLSGCKLGMLINFNVTFIKLGVRRVINGTL